MTSTRRPSQQNNRQRPPQTESVAPVTVSTNPQPEEPKLPLERIGDMLKRVRLERGDDIQQIADYLCIRRSFLTALENNKYEEFPADAYVIGFLRSYAEFLGVNSKEAIDRYRNEMAGRRKKPALLIPTPITEGRTPSGVIMAAAAVAALLIYALWYGLSSSDRSTITTPPALPSAAVPNDAMPASPTDSTAAPAIMSGNQPISSVIVPPPEPLPATAPVSSSAPAANAAVPETTTPAQAPVATTPAPAAPAPQPAAATTPPPATPSEKEHLTIRAEQSTWVLVTDNKGHPLYDHVMKPGEVYKVPRTPNLSLTTGNGSGIVLTLDGTDLPKLATGSSHVVRNIPLDDQHLKSLPSNPDD